MSCTPRAKTRAERDELAKMFEAAWTALADRYSRPKKRLLYKLAPTLGELTDPVKAAQKLVQRLSDFGHEVATLHRFRGLNDFFDSLCVAPIRDRNRELIAGLFPRIAEDAVWNAGSKLAASTDAVFVSCSVAATART